MKNYGLIIPEIKTREEGAEHLLGSKLRGFINEDGDWTKFLPVGELQNRGDFEPNSCVSHGSNSCIETLIKFKTGNELNYSDRALAIASDTNPNAGNNPHKVCETIRVILGALPEKDLPHDSSVKTLEQYYSGLTEPLKEKARTFWNSWKFSHEWITNPTKENLQTALRGGTVGVAVHAWQFQNGVYVFPQGASPNHWVQLVKYDGENPIVFDSYSDNDNTPFLKKLDKNYPFKLAKVYYLEPNTEAPPVSFKEWLKKQLDAIQAFINDYLRPSVNKVAPIKEGIDETPPPPAEPSGIEKLGKAIEKYENVNKSLNNPGGLRYSPFQSGFIIQSTTGKKLATFKTYVGGWGALMHQIRIVCNGTSPAYTKEAKTLGLNSCSELNIAQFLHIYAPRYENETEKYIRFIETSTGYPRSTKMKELL